MTELQLKNYLSNYLTEVLSYIQSPECKERLSTTIATILHWLINYLLIPIGAVIVYTVICTFNSLTDAVITTTLIPVTSKEDAVNPASKPNTVVEPMSVNIPNQNKTEGQEDIECKHIKSYEIEYGHRVTEIYHSNRESDFGEGWFTNTEPATEESPF